MATASTITESDFVADAPEFRASTDEFTGRGVVGLLNDWRAGRGTGREFFEQAGEHGLLGAVVPSECGGAGLSDRRYAHLIVESLSAVGAVGTALAVGFHTAVALPVLVAQTSKDTQDLIESAAVGATVIA